MKQDGTLPLEIDKRRLDRIKVRILTAEQDNLRTRADSFDQMADKLRKIIEEEVKKCF